MSMFFSCCDVCDVARQFLYADLKMRHHQLELRWSKLSWLLDIRGNLILGQSALEPLELGELLEPLEPFVAFQLKRKEKLKILNKGRQLTLTKASLAKVDVKIKKFRK